MDQNGFNDRNGCKIIAHTVVRENDSYNIYDLALLT